LIGLQESRWFDVKSHPYRLVDDRQKWELAKDMSALANADGGVILIAAETVQPATYLEERVSKVVPVPASLIDVKRYLDTIGRWTVPSLAHRIRSHLFPRADDKVLFALEVPSIEPDEKPILVSTNLPLGGADVAAWAIARRVGSGTEWVNAAQVWADIRDGRLARRNLSLATPLNSGPSPEDRATEAARRLSALVSAEGQSMLAYVAIPPPGQRLESFYSDDGIRGALRDLPRRGIRSSGFGLGYGLKPESAGRALADIEEGRRGVMVDLDGTLTAVAIANRDFLGWADRGIPPNGISDRPAIGLNRYVLAEYSLEFSRFLRSELITKIGVDGWYLAVLATRLQSGDPAPYLPDSVNPLSHSARTAVVDEGLAVFPATEDPEQNAYELLRRYVEWFGCPPDAVPFGVDERISEETVLSWSP